MHALLDRIFNLRANGTNVRTEVVAGVVTFVTMAYIIVVNPAILEAAGIPKGPSMVATILTAAFGTIMMGLYANRPFALAPYMGENAFVAFTVVKVLGYSWQTALGAIFIGGVLFTILTVLRARDWLAKAIPMGLNYSIAVGIGLFITFIGLNETGFVTLGMPGAPVHVGNVTSPSVLVSIAGFFVIGVLMVCRVKGAILIGVLGASVLAFLGGVAEPPARWVCLQCDLRPIFLQLDILGAVTWGFFAVILTVFVMDFVDTIGTLIGLSVQANLMDERGHLPGMEKALLADALSTVAAALLGTTTAGTYVESAAGIEEGGRTGLTAIVVALLFLAAIFFQPFLTAVPPQAYGPALIIVGMLMMSPITRIDFSDFTEVIPAFGVVTLMSFTYNIGIGMTAGFILYPFFKLVGGRAREIHPGLMVLCGLSLLFYVFYPY